MSISWNNTLTTVFNDLLTIAASYAGIGYGVTTAARTSGVVTLTTATAHNFVAGSKILVRGTKTLNLDGEFVVIDVPTATTFTYALAGTDVTSAGVVAGASSQIGAGYKRYDDDENWEQAVEGFTPGVQGFFDLEMGRVTLSELDSFPATLKAALYVFVPKDNSDNLSAAWDFAISFFNALLVSASYPAGHVYPNKATISLKEIENIDSGGIAMFDCGCFGSGGIELPNI